MHFQIAREPVAMAGRPPRSAAVAGTDRMRGGVGAKPLRPERVDRDIEFRVRQAAIDVMCDVHHAESPALLADWGLSHSQLPAIARGVHGFT